jgi:hypothetical protein
MGKGRAFQETFSRETALPSLVVGFTTGSWAESNLGSSDEAATAPMLATNFLREQSGSEITGEPPKEASRILYTILDV